MNSSYSVVAGEMLDMEHPCYIVVARFIIWNTNSPLERGFQTLGIDGFNEGIYLWFSTTRSSLDSSYSFTQLFREL